MLSFRLNKIKTLVDKDSSVVWDLCCDHGKLGEEFIKEDISKVYFVDQVGEIIERLEKRLKRNYPEERFDCYATKASDIPVANLESETIIIAGVGGYTCIEIIDSLLSRFSKINARLIISPQKNLDKVKDFLFESHFSVISHDIIFDKKQKYDILKIEHLEGDVICN